MDESYEEHRQYLIGVCYRMLGSVADAEDVVQEAYLRWESSGRPELDNPRAWYTRVCVRLCLDHVKKAHVRREQYPGPWLPEPIVDGEHQVEIDESISIALLIVMQRLSAAERAIFILHDVFGFPYRDVGEMLQLTETHCRQLATRARQHLRGETPRFETDAAQVRALSESFFQAIKDGNLDQLQSLLADDVVLVSDGGGKAPAVPYPIVGRDKVHRFLTGIYQIRKGPLAEAVQMDAIWFNGAPGVLVRAEGYSPSAYQFEVRDNRIERIFVQRNPEKLARLVSEEE